jgi:hypothetical protein
MNEKILEVVRRYGNENGQMPYLILSYGSIKIPAIINILRL